MSNEATSSSWPFGVICAGEGEERRKAQSSQFARTQDERCSKAETNKQPQLATLCASGTPWSLLLTSRMCCRPLPMMPKFCAVATASLVATKGLKRTCGCEETQWGTALETKSLCQQKRV